jgi:hypothetical protein
LIKILDKNPTKERFGIESFIKRIKIIRERPREILDLSNIPSFLLQTYPFFGPVLDSILQPGKEGDISRRNFVKFVCGTEYSDSEISLKDEEIPFNDLSNGSKLYRLPYSKETCRSTLELFEVPSSRNYEEKFNVRRINKEIMKVNSLEANN